LYESFESVDNFTRRAPVRDLHVALNIPYVYYFVKKLYRKQAEGIQTHQYPSDSNTGQDEERIIQKP
jgi:hypothetical protein